jgi:hypothetical protein
MPRYTHTQGTYLLVSELALKHPGALELPGERHGAVLLMCRHCQFDTYTCVYVCMYVCVHVYTQLHRYITCAARGKTWRRPARVHEADDEHIHEREGVVYICSIFGPKMSSYTSFESKLTLDTKLTTSTPMKGRRWYTLIIQSCIHPLVSKPETLCVYDKYALVSHLERMYTRMYI